MEDLVRIYWVLTIFDGKEFQRGISIGCKNSNLIFVLYF